MSAANESLRFRTDISKLEDGYQLHRVLNKNIESHNILIIR